MLSPLCFLASFAGEKEMRGEKMPTERFYNLPLEKKKAIREAAVGEFSQVSFEKVSINKMIQKAGISRGSFYTYFQDKFDVLAFLFEDAAEKLLENWSECAGKCGGNLWKTSEDFLNGSITNTKEHMLLMKNLIDSEKVFGEIYKVRQSCGSIQCAFLEGLYNSVDKRDFKDQSMESFENLISMIFLELTYCMNWHFHQPEDAEKIKKIFQKKLEILQYGVCRHQL
jgi:AcrR family transcriptional regulator